MFNIGGGEMVVLAILALLVFGPEGLPDIVKTVTRTLRAFRTAASDFQQEINTALNTENEQRRVAERRRRKVVVEPVAEEPAPSNEAETLPTELVDTSAEAVAEQSEPTPSPLHSDTAETTAPETEPAAPEVSAQEPELDATTDTSSEEEPSTPRLSGDAPPPNFDDGDDDGPGRPMSRPSRPATESSEAPLSPTVAATNLEAVP